MKPVVSIIIPAYNASKTIKRCLDSLLKQTLKDIEIIVINDCSKDDTLEILKSIEDCRLVILDNEKNLGPAASRNRGLKIANGKYIGFTDADDYIDKNMYKIMTDNMKNNIDLVCGSRYNVINGELKPIINKYNTSNPKDFSKTSNYIHDKLFKKSIIDKYNLKLPEEYKYAEDFAFLVRYKYYAREMVILDKPLYYYVYDSEGSITNTYNENILKIVDVLADAMEFFKSEGVFDEYSDELMNVSKGYYIRRVREFKNFKNLKLKVGFINKFFKFFKHYFPNYKKSLKEFNGAKCRLYFRSRILMIIYVSIRQLWR